MGKEDLQKLSMLVMLVALIYTAPQWLDPGALHASTYNAPWIYPGAVGR